MRLIRQVAVAGTLAAQLVRLAYAQNSSLPEHCDLTIQQAAAGGFFNSTGTGEIQFARQDSQHPLEPWYMTQTLHVTRDEKDAWRTQSLTVFLSVPESFVGSDEANNTNVCAYRMRGLNATAHDDGSCDELLSDDCLDAIDDLPAMPDSDGNCPSVNVQDACGQGFFLSTARPFNFSSSVCSISGLSGSDLPDNYRTFTGIGTVTLSLTPETDDDPYAMYDLRVRQPAPVLIKARLGASGSVAYQQQKMLCIAPNKVVEGSRRPVGDFPPSSASGAERPRTMMLVLAVSLAVAGGML
ncbi:hypothetical protein LMH87_003201 [Akanthomyces muscarius]|uniref:Uncharacterized protein n=1 Tax=Akanthomyces muscarius TaxID=2231603 RepID=A0A9W8Q2U5_AKAMU|nr:hypothetical protein LMH87_003201 [Akanthomyces muscarius]KAJ4144311.1 hypothetical protein LMH87_003201 [Akanthomyces muscarius]